MDIQTIQFSNAGNETRTRRNAQNDGNLQTGKVTPRRDVNYKNIPSVLQWDGFQPQSNPESVRNSSFGRQPARTGITYCPRTLGSSFLVHSVGASPGGSKLSTGSRNWRVRMDASHDRIPSAFTTPSRNKSHMSSACNSTSEKGAYRLAGNQSRQTRTQLRRVLLQAILSSRGGSGAVTRE